MSVSPVSSMNEIVRVDIKKKKKKKNPEERLERQAGSRVWWGRIKVE